MAKKEPTKKQSQKGKPWSRENRRSGHPSMAKGGKHQKTGLARPGMRGK